MSWPKSSVSPTRRGWSWPFPSGSGSRVTRPPLRTRKPTASAARPMPKACAAPSSPTSPPRRRRRPRPPSRLPPPREGTKAEPAMRRGDHSRQSRAARGPSSAPARPASAPAAAAAGGRVDAPAATEPPARSPRLISSSRPTPPPAAPSTSSAPAAQSAPAQAPAPSRPAQSPAVARPTPAPAATRPAAAPASAAPAPAAAPAAAAPAPAAAPTAPAAVTLAGCTRSRGGRPPAPTRGAGHGRGSGCSPGRRSGTLTCHPAAAQSFRQARAPSAGNTAAARSQWSADSASARHGWTPGQRAPLTSRWFLPAAHRRSSRRWCRPSRRDRWSCRWWLRRSSRRWRWRLRGPARWWSPNRCTAARRSWRHAGPAAPPTAGPPTPAQSRRARADATHHVPALDGARPRRRNHH